METDRRAESGRGPVNQWSEFVSVPRPPLRVITEWIDGLILADSDEVGDEIVAALEYLQEWA